MRRSISVRKPRALPYRTDPPQANRRLEGHGGSQQVPMPDEMSFPLRHDSLCPERQTGPKFFDV